MPEPIQITSSLHTYSVNFVDSTKNALDSIVGPGDVVLFDTSLSQLLKLPDSVKRVGIHAREEEKDFENLSLIIQNIISMGFKRGNKLVAIGGGVTQDITGFIASILFRGVPWIFFPTTLLSQGDSCIGGKTSINLKYSKNLLGTFYPPLDVYVDVGHLRTLPNSQIASGIGEMCHYFLVDSEKSFSDFSHRYESALLRNVETLEDMVWQSLMIKKRYIEADEFDKGARLVLNYGHSFGHAIESISQYKIPHGIAVCFGMDIANYVSVRFGYLDLETYRSIKTILADIRLGWTLPDFSSELLVSTLRKDKKNTGDKLTLILTKGVGEMFIQRVSINKTLFRYIGDYIQDTNPQ